MLRMSVRENIELHGGIDNEPHLQILRKEYGAAPHPVENRAYILGGLPFHSPSRSRYHLSILSFIDLPLPDALLEALIKHPELFPDQVLIRWAQEQHLSSRLRFDSYEMVRQFLSCPIFAKYN